MSLSWSEILKADFLVMRHNYKILNIHTVVQEVIKTNSIKTALY